MSRNNFIKPTPCYRVVSELDLVSGNLSLIKMCEYASMLYIHIALLQVHVNMRIWIPHYIKQNNSYHMAKNSRMALCCQNQVSKGTNQCYGLHSSASSSVHSASVAVRGLLKKKKKKKEKKN